LQCYGESGFQRRRQAWLFGREDAVDNPIVAYPEPIPFFAAVQSLDAGREWIFAQQDDLVENPRSDAGRELRSSFALG